MLQYKTYVDHDSTYNTPPVFNIYFVNKVAHWLDDNGGLAAMHERNKKKAAIVYGVIDDSNGFYRGHARVDSRSLMNVTFNLPTKELEASSSLKRLITTHRCQGAPFHRRLPGIDLQCRYRRRMPGSGRFHESVPEKH